MPAYNFKRRFVKKVESGQKTQTIRKIRKYPTKKGQTIYLWTGLRTKRARRLGIGMITSVEPFFLPEPGCFRVGDDYTHDWYLADDDETGLMLAQADGFDDWDSFVWFFETHYGLPFEGELIKWRLLG